MLDQNKELFEKFNAIYAKYEKDPKSNQTEFNEVGRDVQDVMRRYENMLCRHSESSGYSKYSTTLAEKFQAQVRAAFPKIDLVGLEIDEA